MDKMLSSDERDIGSIPVSSTNCRYSLVVKQILGKDQRRVQFSLSAPYVYLHKFIAFEGDVYMGIFSRFKNEKENKDTNFLENYIKSQKYSETNKVSITAKEM